VTLRRRPQLLVGAVWRLLLAMLVEKVKQQSARVQAPADAIGDIALLVPSPTLLPRNSRENGENS